MITSVGEQVREAENNFNSSTTQISEYVDWSLKETLDKIDAYLNSRHISGEEDSLGRKKPFFNIVSAAVNIWYRATDLDRKDIKILPRKQRDTLKAFIATVILQQWMDKTNFGQFLNQWGRQLAQYGSSIVKFVEKDGELIPSVIPWSRFIADPVQFDALPRIEKFYKTPAQLRQIKEYDQDQVDQLVSALTTRKTIRGVAKDIMPEFVELYEVHGLLDERLLQDNPDESLEDKDIVYRQQMHVISFAKSGKEYLDFTLYKGREKKDPYMLTHLIEEDGRVLSIGAVEYLFQAQWMMNHTVKNMKDTLDLTSKLIFQTADSKFVGRNVLNAIETGSVLIHTPNNPLTEVNNSRGDIVALQNFGTMWQTLGQELTSTPEAARGVTPPSGTALGTVNLVTSQGLSLFSMMVESKGLYLEQMLREFIIPFIKTKMNHKDEVVAILDEEDIHEIDSIYVPLQAVKNFNDRNFQAVLNIANGGAVPSPYNAQLEQANVKEGLKSAGNTRIFVPDDLTDATWKEALKDLEWDVTVEITDENVNKQVVLQTLSTVMQTIATNPQILNDPNGKMLFGRILTETGVISPLELQRVASQPAPATPPQVPPATALPRKSVAPSANAAPLVGG